MTRRELAGVLGEGSPILVLDVRPIAAYNGWALSGEARGGHIAGAIPFPLSWLGGPSDGAIVSALEDRGVLRGGDVAVYGYDREEAESAAARLEALGHGSPRVLADGLEAWAGDSNLPMDRLPRYTRLVHEGWLGRMLGEGRAPHHDGGRFLLAHTSFDNSDDYRRGHIPGALSLDTLFLEEPEHWNRRNPEELTRALTDLGITCDTTVVLYGRCGNPTMEMTDPGRAAGQIAAMRAAVLLLYAGVEDVRVLDGGIDAWLAGGHSLSAEETVPVPVVDFGRAVPARPELIVDTEEAKDLLADSGGELVSMRSWREFIGEVSGYHYVGPRGRIPGAVFGNCGSDAYHMENYRNPDNTMRCYHDIAARWREAGITPDKRIAFYCGTGWRASEAFFYAYLMGWDRIAVYDGGWYEWSMDEGNPTETGIPEGYDETGNPLAPPLAPR